MATFFSHHRLPVLRCHPFYFLLKNWRPFFAHASLILLLISLGCHPTPFLPVRPRLSTILCKFALKFFSFTCQPPGGNHPGRSAPQPPSDATGRRHSVAVFNHSATINRARFWCDTGQSADHGGSSQQSSSLWLLPAVAIAYRRTQSLTPDVAATLVHSCHLSAADSTTATFCCIWRGWSTAQTFAVGAERCCRLATGTRRIEHITPVRRSWPPVRQRDIYQMAMLVSKCITIGTAVPSERLQVLGWTMSTQYTRSADSYILDLREALATERSPSPANVSGTVCRRQSVTARFLAACLPNVPLDGPRLVWCLTGATSLVVLL